MKPTQPPRNAQIRKHYFLDQYSIIAPSRNVRPDSFAAKSSSHKLETPTSPRIELDKAILSIPDDDGRWAVKVVANKFPALSINNLQAYGKQEVVIETPDHNLEFSELSLNQIMRIFRAYRERLTTLKALKGIRYISVFKNDGPNAGASIAHSHSQITALPLVPPDLAIEAAAVDAYFNEHQSCPYCDLLIWEVQQKVRVIYQDKAIVVVAPYASRYGFECWIIPRRHLGSFTDLTHDEQHSIATILKNLTSKLDSIKVSYNFFLQNSLANRDHHLVIKLEPRPTVWAGLELGTGIIINTISPEYSALWYKNQLA